MKYLIIPLFRVITLPILIIGVFFVIIYGCAEFIWELKSDTLYIIFSKHDAFMQTSDGYYKTVWDYIINNKK